MSTASDTIDNYLSELPEWQRSHLTKFRELVHEAVPSIAEDWKWNVPVFVANGKILFAMSAFKDHTKYNFIQNGALLDNTDGLFNNGLGSKKSRGIDLHEHETVDEHKLKALIQKAANLA